LFILLAVIAFFSALFYLESKPLFSAGDPPFPGFEEGQLNQCPPKKVYECKEVNTKSKPVELTQSGLGLSEKSLRGLLALLEQYNSLILWMNDAQCHADCAKKQFSGISFKFGYQGAAGSCSNPPPPKSGTISKTMNAFSSSGNTPERINDACTRIIALALDDLLGSNFCPAGCSPTLTLSEPDFTFVETPSSNPYAGSSSYSYLCKIKYTLTCTGPASSDTAIAWLEGKVCVGCEPKPGTTPGGSEQDEPPGGSEGTTLGETGQYIPDVGEE